MTAREDALRAALERIADCATAYRAEEQADTPRLWRGKKLQDLATELDNAIEARAALTLDAAPEGG